MATWFVNSAATGTNAGTSWVNACTSFAQLLALATPPAAGDDINVKNTHSETTASAVTLTWPGTAAAPNRIFSCDSVNQPAQASDLAAGAKMSTTGASSTINWNGSFYVFGVTLNAGASSNVASLGIAGTAGNYQVWDTCSLVLNNTSGSSVLNVPNAAAASVDLINTTMTFGSVSQSNKGSGRLRWFDTASAFGGATFPTTLFAPASVASILLSGVDLNSLGSGKTIFGAVSQPVNGLMLNCKLGASVTIAATPTTLSYDKIDLVNCDSTATGYRQERYWYNGTLTTSTSVTNNATDGVQAISWTVATNGNAKRQAPFECFEIVQWVAAGTYANSTIQITSATAALTNADVWVDCQVLSNASFPIATLTTSGPATQLTAGSGLAAGTWAVGGLGNNYQLAIPSFTVNTPGYVRFVVKVGKASLTVNVDPAVTVAA